MKEEKEQKPFNFKAFLNPNPVPVWGFPGHHFALLREHGMKPLRLGEELGQEAEAHPVLPLHTPSHCSSLHCPV